MQAIRSWSLRRGGAADPSTLRTINIAVSGLPSTTGDVNVQSGENCTGSAYLGGSSGTVSFQFPPRCLQQDGKVTLYAEATDSTSGMATYHALLTDVTPPAEGATGTATIGSGAWVFSLDQTVTLDFTHAPGTILDSATQSVEVDFSPERKGQHFTLRSTTTGAASGSAFLGTTYAYPGALPFAANGEGFLTSYVSGVLDAGRRHGVGYGGYAEQSLAILSPDHDRTVAAAPWRWL